MSSLVGRKIFRIVKQIPLIPIDDAFMGICLKTLRLKPLNHNGFKNWGAKYMAKLINLNCTLQDVMVWHKFSSTSLISTWKTVPMVQPYFYKLCSSVFTAKTKSNVIAFRKKTLLYRSKNNTFDFHTTLSTSNFSDNSK